MISPVTYAVGMMMAQAQNEVTAMNGGIQDLLVYLCGAAIVGIVVALVSLWREFTAHKLHVAEVYMNSHDVDEIKSELRGLRDVVYKIAVKMDVPTFSEPYRRL